MLGLSNLSRTVQGERVLVNVTLDLSPGRPTAIVGLSNVGRDAVARLLTGLDKPQEGTVRLGGADTTRARKDKGRIQRVGPAVPPASGQRVGKLIGAEAAASAGLSAKLNSRVSELTPDQRIRLSIAQALAARPSLLVLDGPAGGLPSTAYDDFAEHIGEMVATSNAVVVLLASGAHEALGLRGDIVVIDGGTIVQSGPAADVSAHPVNFASAVATSWPTLNTLPMNVRDGRCLLADGSSLQIPEGLPSPPDGPCTLAFHPEDATLERASPGCVRFVVRSAAEEVRGEFRFLNVGFANQSWMCPLAMAAPHAGTLMNAFVDRSHILVFDAAGRALG